MSRSPFAINPENSSGYQRVFVRRRPEKMCIDMENHELQVDEVILYEDTVTSSDIKGNLLITLSSRQLIIMI